METVDKWLQRRLELLKALGQEKDNQRQVKLLMFANQMKVKYGPGAVKTKQEWDELYTKFLNGEI